MRTKLFLAFLAVITTAFISNLLFEHFISRDFEDYVNGAQADRLYWILAAVEGSYAADHWDKMLLRDAVHWAMMLGFDIKIEDNKESPVIDSAQVMQELSQPMRQRMEGIVEIGSARGEYDSYPLYVEGREIGTLWARPFKRSGQVGMKVDMFKRRGKEFLVTSSVIAGGSAILLAVFLSLFLSRPLKNMKMAVEAFAKGDFSVRVPEAPNDEVGRLAASFNFMAEALEREEALRKHLTSNVAHELRTPLAVIKGTIEAMADGVVENREEGIESIRGEVERLISLVEGIEDITKAEASFFVQRELTEINIPEFLRTLAAKFQPLAAEKDLALTVVGTKDLRVMTDEEKLGRIVQNILSNAVRHTTTGGILIEYGLGRETFSVEVRDSGPGIPEDRLPHLFKRFYKGADSQGLGLGLAIVKELTEVMGGTIDVRSQIGRGTVFSLKFPLRRQP